MSLIRLSRLDVNGRDTGWNNGKQEARCGELQRASRRRRRRPTLPPPLEGSTIGADRLNDRVRDGNGCGPVALVASKRTTDECGVVVVFRKHTISTKRRDQASRAISTARLKRSRALHLPPINVVVSHGPSGVLRPGSVHLGEGFPLRCIQRLSPRDIANRRCPWQDSPYTRDRFVPVLSY